MKKRIILIHFILLLFVLTAFAGKKNSEAIQISGRIPASISSNIAEITTNGSTILISKNSETIKIKNNINNKVSIINESRSRNVTVNIPYSTEKITTVTIEVL